MPIVTTDIKFYLSGGAANSDPNASLGGVISSTEVSGTALNNIFDDVSGDESGPGDVEYRGIYVKNTHGSLTLQGAKLWLESEVSGGGDIAIALAGEGLNATMETVVNESTAPVGESFTSPTCQGSRRRDAARGRRHGSLEARRRKGKAWRRWLTTPCLSEIDLRDHLAWQPIELAP
jgi:hypothetical protein